MVELSVDQIKRIVEASLLMNREPQPVKKLAELFTPEENVNERAISDTLTLIAEDYRGRGVELVEVATGYRFQVCADLSPWIQRTMTEKPQRYSRALLETLALIAYRQPITRAEIEEVRGVVVSTQIMRTLEEREWVRVIGHRDVPGRPALYATTKQFLNDLNLKSLGELPTLAELQDLDKIDGEFQQLNLDIANTQEGATESSEVSNEGQQETHALEDNLQDATISEETQELESNHSSEVDSEMGEIKEPIHAGEIIINHDNGEATMDYSDEDFEAEEINEITEITEISWQESEIGAIDEEEEELLSSDEAQYDDESEITDEDSEDSEETNEDEDDLESEENEWDDEELEDEEFDIEEDELTETEA